MASATYGYQVPPTASSAAFQPPSVRLATGTTASTPAPPLSAREHGMSPYEVSRVAMADQAKAALGVMGLGGAITSLGKVYIPHQGPEMLSAAQTGIKHTSPAMPLVDQSHADLHAYLGAETAGKLDAALSLSGTPASFHLNDTQHLQAHRAALATQLALEGNPNPDIMMLMSATAPFTASRGMIQNALRAQAELSYPTTDVPRRWMWASPAWRQSVPMPVLGANGPQFGITPAQEDYMMSITCGADVGPIRVEPY